MAIPKGKQRITITIHNETRALLDELSSLHENSTYSNVVEVALYFYAKMIESKLNPEESKGDVKNGKN